MSPHPLEIAYFVSPHGFGHAARASAIISALQDRFPHLHVTLFSRIPPWFFEEALTGSYTYRDLMTDIGLVQSNPLEENLSETVQRLDEFLPFNTVLIDELAKQLKGDRCRLIICDISPMGIIVGERAGIPTVLIENFTWDWIYEGYGRYREALCRHIQYLREVFSKATFRIQTEPACDRREVDLNVGPISRSPTQSRSETREQLRISESQKLVLITMGGIPGSYNFLEDLYEFTDCRFLVPGNNTRLQEDHNLILLPYQSGYYHPDLVQAADVVIGKVGYSTLAEVYYAGVPFGYLTRSAFRESPVLSAFIDEHMAGIGMPGGAYLDGSWIDFLPGLLELPKIHRNEVNNSAPVADFILNQITIGDRGR